MDTSSTASGDPAFPAPFWAFDAAGVGSLPARVRLGVALDAEKERRAISLPGNTRLPETRIPATPALLPMIVWVYFRPVAPGNPDARLPFGAPEVPSSSDTRGLCGIFSSGHFSGSAYPAAPIWALKW